MHDLAVYEEIVRLSKKGDPFALATIVSSSGSTPRKSGAKMLVRHDGSILGTICGGNTETEVIDAALAAIDEGQPRMFNLTFTEKYGHVCGGKNSVFLEPIGLLHRLIIIGAGHVGCALAHTAKLVGFRVVAVDEQAECAEEGKRSGADEVLIGGSQKILPNLSLRGKDFIVIATSTYESDFDAVRAALKTPAGYIGMIGSKRKRELLFKTLMEEGVSKNDLARLTIPVGLPIGADSPEEIAVSIASELIQKRKEYGTNTISNSSCGRKVPADGNAKTAFAVS